MMKDETMRIRMEKMVQRMQDSICKAIEDLDGTRFSNDIWYRPDGGGGTSTCGLK